LFEFIQYVTDQNLNKNIEFFFELTTIITDNIGFDMSLMDIFYVVSRKIYNREIVDIKQFSDRLFVLCVQKSKLPYLFNMEQASLSDNESKLMELREKIRTCVV